MKPQKFLVKTFLSFLAVFAIFLPTASGWTTPEQFQAGGDLVLDSEKVCSPRTSNKCLPGPFQETVTIPEGVTGVNIDVYWIWTGDPTQNQSNEHSYFTATAGGNQLGQVYCQDFGNEAQTHSQCGSVSGSVSAGQTLTLEIVHADPNRGPTPGSHRQQWVLNWVEAVPPTNTPVVEPPVFTNTPTSLPPTEVPPTNTPTSTSVVQPPVFTNTPTSQPPTEVPPTRTPTEVPSEEEENPRPTRTPTPLVSGPSITNTPGPVAQVSSTPPGPTPTRTPPAVLPVTGGDYAGPSLVDFAWKAGLVLFGLLLAAFGLFRELRDARR